MAVNWLLEALMTLLSNSLGKDHDHTQKNIYIHYIVTTKIERYHEQNDSSVITQT